MDSFEWNKVFGALLAAAFVVLGLNFLSDGLFHAKTPEQAGFIIAGAEASAKHGGEAKAAVEIDAISGLLASADLAKGQKVAKKCAACHNFEKGAKNKVGPGLFGILDRPIGTVEGFKYSAALKGYAPDKSWSYDELNKFLFKPKTAIKGTSMGFAGVKKTEERAALIAYLRSLADTPAPLPTE